MKFMVIANATKDGEAGTWPTTEQMMNMMNKRHAQSAGAR